jgi:hypothetical protein
MTTHLAEDEDKPMTADEQAEMDAMLEELTDGGVRVIWLSSDDEDPEGINPSFEEMATEFAALPQEKHAAFEVGDVVVTLNPYTGDFQIHEEDSEIPQYYQIMDVKRDDGCNTFRYLLSGTDSWCAEEWLDIPDVPVMMKTWVEFSASDTVEKPAMDAKIDALTTEYISNSYLDMMNSTDAAVRKTGLEGLKAMVAEGVI